MTKIEQKQDELIKLLKDNLCDFDTPFNDTYQRIETLESELSSLKTMEGNQLPATDEDIEKWAKMEAFGDISDKTFESEKSEHTNAYFIYRALIYSAKAMRDGLIKKGWIWKR